MTYLTRANVDFALAAKRGFRDSYRWHQAVWEAFPGRADEKRDFLTRLDRRKDGFRLLIISDIAPTRPDWSAESEWQTKVIPESFFRSSCFLFQLCANPSKKVAKEGPDGVRTKNGRRVPLQKREELEAWILRKAGQGGFVVNAASLRIVPRGREYFEIHSRNEKGLHSAVEFEGVLTVMDAAKFRETFVRGIGSAKGFGFGMLALQPVRGSQRNEEDQ
jgi:CRISPR system Cascade subunit CasE